MRWLARGPWAVVALAAALSGAAPGDAAAVTRVDATLQPAGFASRVVVTVRSTTGFTSRTRPRSVRIRYGRATYTLYRVARPAAARGATSTWRTAARRDLRRLLGRRVAIAVRTGVRMTTFRRVVTRPRPQFRPPPRRATGEEAFRRISRYFVNSRFTNCPEGWPACPTERRIHHCAGGGMTGAWQSQSLPAELSPTRSTYEVLTASHETDGSWGITYKVAVPGTTSVYSWIVRPDGNAQGVYSIGQEVGFLRGFRWQQPAGC